MSIQSKTTLKSYFNTGDKPTEAQFADLIDSCYNGLRQIDEQLVSNSGSGGGFMTFYTSFNNTNFNKYISSNVFVQLIYNEQYTYRSNMIALYVTSDTGKIYCMHEAIAVHQLQGQIINIHCKFTFSNYTLLNCSMTAESGQVAFLYAVALYAYEY